MNIKRFSISLLFLCLIILMSGLVMEGLYTRHHFKQVIINGHDVAIVRGIIKRAKKYYAGRSWDNLNIFIKGYPNWIQVHDVSEKETNLLKKGAIVSIEIYKPARLWLTDEYSLSRQLALGVEVNSQIIRKSDIQKQKKLQSYNILIGLTIIGLFIALIGSYAVYKSGQPQNR